MNSFPAILLAPRRTARPSGVPATGRNLMTSPTTSPPPVTRREIFAWAMYDFANSGYTTVVLTAIFNAYFVGVVASSDATKGAATLLWTVATAIANMLVLLTAPVLGAVADHNAHKKRFLALTTAGCVIFT